MEMMVAMVIMLVVLGAVVALYLSSSQTANFQAGVQRVQENGQFAIDMMSRSLRMAGYDDPADTFIVAPELVLKGTVGSSGTLFSQPDLKANADTVGASYQGGTDIVDCQGRPIQIAEYVSNLYAVSNDDALVCATQDNSGNTVAISELVEGVEDMVVLYGQDIDSDGFANRFVDAAGVGDWNEVVSIQVSLLMNSVTPVLPTPATVCLGCLVFQGSNDRLIRGEFQTTVAIRN